MRITKIAVVIVAALGAAGCANITVPPPQASAANVTTAKQLPESVKVSTFKLAPGLSPGIDQSISVRGANSLNAPSGKTFSGYLREVLITELRAANKLDEAAGLTITGELTKSELEAGMSTGTGTVGARFVASRAGATCFDKQLVATSQWESSFVAAIAVPAAFDHYTALYADLAGKLLADPEFKQRCMTHV